MNIVKRYSILILCFIMMILAASCSSTKDSDNIKENDADDVKEESRIYDTGSFTVSIPNGWKEFTVNDIWAEDTGTVDPDILQIIKGGETAIDSFDHPYIYINYYGPETEMITPDMNFYENGKELEPVSFGDYTWEGFTATTLDYPITVLWRNDGDIGYQVTVYTDQEKGNISLEDSDVIEIISSIK